MRSIFADQQALPALTAHIGPMEKSGLGVSIQLVPSENDSSGEGEGKGSLPV